MEEGFSMFIDDIHHPSPSHPHPFSNPSNEMLEYSNT
jgi:hypothetical protein